MVFTLLFFLHIYFPDCPADAAFSFRFTKAEVVVTFGFKVLMACAYGYVFLHYYGGDDTWKLPCSFAARVCAADEGSSGSSYGRSLLQQPGAMQPGMDGWPSGCTWPTWNIV